MDWNWWVVFLPAWVVMLGHMAGFCSDLMQAKKLASSVEGEEENMSEVR